MILDVNGSLVLYTNKTTSFGIETINGIMLTKDEVSYLVNHLETLRYARNKMIVENINEMSIITEEIESICTPTTDITKFSSEMKCQTFKYGHIEMFFAHLSDIMKWL